MKKIYGANVYVVLTFHRRDTHRFLVATQERKNTHAYFALLPNIQINQPKETRARA